MSSSNSLGHWSWASLFKKAFYSSPLLWYAHHERVNKSLLIVRISDLFPRVRERLFTIQCPLSFLVQSIFLEPVSCILGSRSAPFLRDYGCEIDSNSHLESSWKPLVFRCFELYISKLIEPWQREKKKILRFRVIMLWFLLFH